MPVNLLRTLPLLLLLGAAAPAAAQKTKGSSKAEPRFLNDISVDIPSPQPAASTASATAKGNPMFTELGIRKAAPHTLENSGIAIEGAESLQFKYALLLDTEVEQVNSLALFRAIDDWMGTRYVYGGSGKNGIDCSALVQNLFSSHFNLSLPRTAREQYAASERISRTELREGDLVFFNTLGGVSHVGIYLQNNKFLHASSSQGVTISDLYEPYWEKRFIGTGRVEGTPSGSLFTHP